MKKTTAILLASTALISACTPTEPPTFIRAKPAEPPKLEVLVKPESVPKVSQTLKPLPANDEAKPEKGGLGAIKSAQQEARIQSAPDGFINASQYFAYQAGALYELHTAPGYITTISLQPGEKLLNYAIGDTARWVVGDVVNGDETLILVKPTKPKLSTNLVITTDKRIYLIEASSHSGSTYNASIALTYPLDNMFQKVQAIEDDNRKRDEIVATGVPIQQLDFDYHIKGDKPRWRPVRAFDDGAKVYIEFPRDLKTSEAPPLFVTDDGADGQLVNYRVRNRYYVVDRLFDLAELRLADTAVQIEREGKPTGWRSFFNGEKRQSLRRHPDDHGERHGRGAGQERHNPDEHGM